MPFRPLIIIFVFLAGGFSLSAETTSFKTLELSQLEERLEEIDAKLGKLAKTSLRTGVGAIGYRSARHFTDDQVEWVEIHFDREYTLDEIILVPTIFRDSQRGFIADGFPAQFRIISGTSANPKGTLLGDYESPNDLDKGIAPRIIAAKGTKASWIRIEATRLTQRAFNKHIHKHYIFQLSEVFVFSGEKNVALHQAVRASSQHPEIEMSAWDKRYLVDGYTPYLMNAAHGQQSVAYISRVNESPTLTIDLETEVPLSRIHLHALDQSDTVPQAYAGNLGIPTHLKIEGSNHLDFSNAETLLEAHFENTSKTGPIIMRNFPKKSCRYIRLVALDPSESARIGFAEIELFSNHQNIALGKKVTSSGTNLTNRNPSALTDGLNLYGDILPIREWLEQLAQRQSLEAQRPLIEQELALRYDSQKSKLQWISWIAAITLVTAIFLIWLQRLAREKAITRTRERIAANLHDELGANLHAIGLLSDFAKKIVARKDTTGEWAELNEVVDDVRTLTEETGEKARYCTNMLEAKEVHVHLVDEMKRITKRLLSDVEHQASFPSAESLRQLKPRKRIDLYLFYKECLTNIIRHSGATQVTVRLTTSDDSLKLTVSDNGHGLNEAPAPKSLRRRAKILGASIDTETPDSGGTQITLHLSLRRWTAFSLRS